MELRGNALVQMLSAWHARTVSTRRRSRQSVNLQVAGLEERMVLSHVSPAAALGFRGLPGHARHAIMATTNTANTNTNSPRLRGGRIQDAQLTADLQKLRTDTEAVMVGSTVTDAQRLALRNDLRTIAQTGFKIDRAGMNTVGDNVLKALADGSYDSDATKAAAITTSFNSLFTGSTITQAQIDKTFTDFVAVARNLNISTAELDTLAADQAAIKADLTRLGITPPDQHPGDSNTALILGGGFGGRGGPGGPRGFGGRGRF